MTNKLTWCVLTLIASTALAANAAPATHRKAGPDAAGVVTHWVKCDNGNVSTAQCLRDIVHCGPGYDRTLASQAIAACDAIVGLVPEPRK